MPVRQQGFFRRRRLSAGTAGRDHAADPGEPRKSAADHSAREGAGERSCTGRGWAVGQVVEGLDLVFRHGEPTGRANARPVTGSTRPGMTAWLRRVGAFLTAGLEQEPGAALGLVDEGFKQTGGAGVLMV